MFDSRKYSVIVRDDENSFAETYTYNITGEEFAVPMDYNISPADIDVRSYRLQKKMKNFHSSVQSFSTNEYFFPTPGLFNFACDRSFALPIKK